MSETGDNGFTATITTQREQMSLPSELVRLLDSLNALGQEVAVVSLALDDRRFTYYPPAEWAWMPRYGRARQDQEFRPRVLWVRNQSPVTIAVGEHWEYAASLVTTLWVLRNPERISSWPWRVMSGFYEWEGRARAMRMWAREIRDAAGGKVTISELPHPPHWLMDPNDVPRQGDEQVDG